VAEHIVTVERGTVFFMKASETLPRERIVYIATCSCGWKGAPYRISGDANTEATRHALDAKFDEGEKGDGQRGT
jgi:hypothetical protein